MGTLCVTSRQAHECVATEQTQAPNPLRHACPKGKDDQTTTAARPDPMDSSHPLTDCPTNSDALGVSALTLGESPEDAEESKTLAVHRRNETSAISQPLTPDVEGSPQVDNQKNTQNDERIQAPARTAPLSDTLSLCSATTESTSGYQCVVFQVKLNTVLPLTQDERRKRLWNWLSNVIVPKTG
jgi:hypothetical protein